MKKRFWAPGSQQPRLAWHIFAAILVVAVLAVVVTGAMAKSAFDTSFARYLGATTASSTAQDGSGQSIGSAGSGSGRGAGQGTGAGQGMMWRHLLLGSAEQAFLSSVNRGIALSALIAVVLAALVAFVVARVLSRPLKALTATARARIHGESAADAPVSGPYEVAELAQAFNEMTHSLDEAEHIRRRMAADIAHELRNPLAALRAQIEGMADGVLPATGSRLGSLASDAAALSRLVDEMQELSLADTGGLSYTFERFDMVDAVRAEVARAQTLARPEVAVSAVVPTESVLVTGDEFRIKQVVRNLLSNAVRHTMSGTIKTEVSMEDASVVVTVVDTGEGIHAEDLPHIWERFYRVDSARAEEKGGAGIGLSIAQRIVEDHGGSVFAESTPGLGSRIGFRIPQQASTGGPLG